VAPTSRYIEDRMASPEVLALVDHLVYGTANLDRGISEVERVLGVRASFGDTQR